MIAICNYCGKEFEKSASHLNRANRLGVPVYCDKVHAGQGRRNNKTTEQKKAEKAEYDRAYREKNFEIKKKKAHEYFKRTYDKEQAALVRKKNMPRHVEYCRRPEYRKWKKEYDKQYHAKKQFGEFAEAALVLFNLEAELQTLEIPLNNHVLNGAQKRKRTWQTQRK